MALIGRGSYNVGVEFEGNWVKFNEIINSTNILLVMAARKGQKDFAENYRDRVKKNIVTGGKRFGYQQSTGEYLRWKQRRGGGTSLLNWSGSFAMAVEIKENRAGSRWSVGIQKGLRRPGYGSGDKNRLTISEYANVLEHGTNNMPARPVFRDTFREMGGIKDLTKAIQKAVIVTYGMRSVRVQPKMI